MLKCNELELANPVFILIVYIQEVARYSIIVASKAIFHSVSYYECNDSN